MISVIIPTLNDASHLAEALDALEPYLHIAEVLVVDGGSDDGTGDVVTSRDRVLYVRSEAGRGVQMNAGAARATGDVFLFLHADTRLPAQWHEVVAATLARPGVALGVFRLRLDSTRPAFRWIELGVRLRTAWLGLPYGDQAMFMKRSDFERAGGFPPLPVMEDVEMVRRMKRLGRVAQAAAPVTSSARAWERDGLWRRTWRNWSTYWRHRSGRMCDHLQSYYRGQRPAVLLFAKEPRPGHVKTRLARTEGDEVALRVYRTMVERTLAATRSCEGSPTVIVLCDPPSAIDRMRAWLGPGPRYQAQSAGDLGDRLHAAFESALAQGFTRVVIVGTDCPALKPTHLEEAFRRLKRNEVVLGPTADGGYYLIGARSAQGALFAGIPWSTPAVLSRTIERIEEASLTYGLLDMLHDLDTGEDLRHHRAAGHLA